MVVVAIGRTLDPHLLSRREVCEHMQTEARGSIWTSVMSAGHQGIIILYNM